MNEKRNQCVSKGVLPLLNKKEGEKLLENLNESKLKKQLFKNSGAELKELLEKENLNNDGRESLSKNKKIVYKIEVYMNPDYGTHENKPIFWVILGTRNSGDWTNEGCGWAETPELAWKKAKEHYDTFNL